MTTNKQKQMILCQSSAGVAESKARKQTIEKNNIPAT
jgi:hypothetical protein